MKKYLLENCQYYKANLHLHSTYSDGKKSPEQLKFDYLEHGYSVIAFTDHDKYLNHNDLSDNEFIVLNGFELEYYITPWRQKCCHLCFIALEDNNQALGYSDPSFDPFVKELGEEKEVYKQGGALYTNTVPERPYDYNYINEDIKRAKELGFFVTYNHPTWSLESFPDYGFYRGIDACEIFNYGCYVEGYSEEDEHVYDDFLNLHKQIYCLSTDDNHNEKSDDGPYLDSYGGYVMIGSDKFDYRSITKALESGNFYSCTKFRGEECPQFREISIDEDRLHIECSPVKSIQLIKNIRPNKRLIGQDKLLESGDFNIGECEWFRVVIEDELGNKSYSNAYFRENI